MQFNSTGKGRIESDKACVLYDPKEGEICYIHRVVTMEGADETPEKEIEKIALRLAKEVGINTRNVKRLHVASDEIKPNFRYSVDPKKRSLVAKTINDEVNLKSRSRQSK